MRARTGQPYQDFIDAVGLAYHQESQIGGPMSPCRLQFGEFIDSGNYCECQYVGYGIAKRLMADPAMNENLKFHEAMGPYGEPRRICTGNAGQRCPSDGARLDCVTDYVGGGSHYWHLWCLQCDTHYTYDTYRFMLEPWDRG